MDDSIGVPSLSNSHANAPLPTPKTNLPSVRISAVATSPAKVRISWMGNTATLVDRRILLVRLEILTAICKGDGIIKILTR